MIVFTASDVAQQVVSGLSTGGVYASLALALVIIYRSTGVINFAQGEMATFTTFIAWSLMHHMSYWPAFVLTCLIAFGGGVALERIVIRPVENAPVLTIVIVTLGLSLIFNGGSAWIWGGTVRSFDSPFSARPVRLPRPEPDAGDLALRICRCCARGAGQSDRRGRRRPGVRRAAERRQCLLGLRRRDAEAAVRARRHRPRAARATERTVRAAGG